MKDTDNDKERGIQRLPIRMMNTNILQIQRGRDSNCLITVLFYDFSRKVR